MLFKLDENGTYDNSFGTAGKVDTVLQQAEHHATEFDLAVLPDGEILIAAAPFGGSYTNPIVRKYLSDGTADSDFGNGGEFISGLDGVGGVSMAVLGDGSILVATLVLVDPIQDECGVCNALFKLDSSGALDPGFGESGVSVFSGVVAEFTGTPGLAVGNDGSIYLSGYDFSLIKHYVLRADAAGAWDTGFGGDGIAEIDREDGEGTNSRLAIHHDGSIIFAAGDNFTGRYLAKLDVGGAPVTAFGTNGVAEIPTVTLAITEMALRDRRLVLTGRGVLQRLHLDGSLDNRFGLSGSVNYSDSIPHGYSSFAFQPDGTIISIGFGPVSSPQYFITRVLWDPPILIDGFEPQL